MNVVPQYSQLHLSNLRKNRRFVNLLFVQVMSKIKMVGKSPNLRLNKIVFKELLFYVVRAVA